MHPIRDVNSLRIQSVFPTIYLRFLAEGILDSKLMSDNYTLDIGRDHRLKLFKFHQPLCWQDIFWIGYL